MPEQFEKMVAAWRQALADKIGNDRNVLDELESHLRDELDRRLKEGKPPELAFQAALAKLGAPDALAPEFAKLAAPWWPIRAVAAALLLANAGVVILVGIRALHSGILDAWLSIHVSAIAIGYLATYGIGVLALCYGCRRMMRELALGQQTSLVRALVIMGWLAFAFTVIGVLTGGVWARDHMGRFWDFWDLRESGAVIVLVWQAVLLGSASRANRSLRWLMCWGVLGNLAVSYAWFVPALLANRHYPYDVNLFGPLLLAGAPILIALMATALLPSGCLRRFLVCALTGAVKQLQED